VYVDEAHYNYHTVDGRYASFAAVLRKDGFVVAPLRQEFSAESLADVNILVIANAMPIEDTHEESERLPGHSAFSDSEIAAIER